jgi:2-succinyl-5-enolpyruvyl-6-hydroxy-3-cyclohexene-1-carboxylate synthase
MSEMIPINRTYAPIQALVDELARSGMRHAVTCPGSRNAPLALTLAAHPDLEAISVLDERSAGFVALGIAKRTGVPVALTTTSGTAAANLLPAVVEAHEARVPLVVMTADRPPELREVGAGQAIDQVKLYGGFAKWFCEVGNHEPGRAAAIHHRQLGCRAFATAAGGRPGPVHLNFPLREPLAPRREEGLAPGDWAGRSGGRPWTKVEGGGAAMQSHPAEVAAAALASAQRGIVVCGPADATMAASALELARRLRWPVFADPLSGVRCGTPTADPVIAHYDLLLRSDRFASAQRSDLVVRTGDMPTSKPLRAWLEDCRQVIADPYLDWHDPTRTADAIWAVDAGQLRDIAENVDPRDDDEWLDTWRRADALIEPLLAAQDEPFEPTAYNVLADLADAVWVSSSMPIRDFESYFPRSERAIRVLANRGANGIDGVVSSAAGAALAARAPVHLVIGELALLHDVGGLVTARRAGAQLAILCVNNGGGGIFDFLPVAEHADSEPYEQHIATPVDFDVAAAARLGGLEHHVATSAAGVRERLRPGTLVELRIDRADSLRRHRELAARVTAELEAL